MIAWLARTGPWWLGFFVVANFYLVPHAGNSPRATDLIGVGLAIWLLTRAHRRGVRSLALAAIAAVNVLPLIWIGASYLDHDNATLIQATRWLLAIPWAMALVELLDDPDDRERFAWGLFVGCAMNAGVVMMQYAGFGALLRPFGFSLVDQDMVTWVGKQARLPGMHRHYGASSAVTSLIVPVSLYFYLRGRIGLWLPLVSLGALALTLHMTFTRSPLVVTAVMVPIALAAAGQPRRSVVLAALLGALAVPALIVVGPPGGSVRWLDSASFEANAVERVGSTLAALEISIENPLGLGVREGRDRITQATAITATHNAFIQASLFLGLPLALALVVAFAHHVWGLSRGAFDDGYLLALLALHLTGLFLFEEHLNNPTFVVLASWMIAASADRFGSRRHRVDEVVAAG